MWAFWETHREAGGVTSLGSWMSQALDEMFHSHIPASSHLSFRQRLQWLSPESQGSGMTPSSPTCTPSQYLFPVQDLWDPLL